MKKFMLIGLTSFLLLSGCSSRQPNVMSTYIPGDSERSCSSLMYEKDKLNSEMTAKWSEKNHQNGTNVALGIAGAFLIVPWFFMDMSGAERTEWESYKKRFDYLGVLMADKKCSIDKNATVDTNMTTQPSK